METDSQSRRDNTELAEDMTAVLAPYCPQPVPPSLKGGMETFGGKTCDIVEVQFPLCVLC